ncbi:ABC transporter ATP-binding protein [Desulfogranum marinum]|uniref:ABC transporter ATP-binding protein n=1 Tax=Desulfogranum marinum TaxID=453220 RepID=UPI0029C83073|nr:ABC transporter ATP-binding protein [Desulfogranum marinum]
MRNYGYSEEGHQGNIKDVHLWRRILTYCRQHAKALWSAIALSLLITVASLMLPKLMQVAIDNFIAPQTSLDLSQRLEGLRNIIIGYGILVGIVFCGGFTQVVLLEWAGQSIMDHVRQKLFAHILTLDMYFFHEQRVGRLVTRLTNDVQNMHEMFTSVMVTLFNDVLKLFGIFCLLYYMNGRLALLMTVFIPLAFWLTFYFSRIAREKFRKIRTQVAVLNGFLAESLTAINIIQVFNRQQTSRQKYFEHTSEYLKKNIEQVRLFAKFMPLTDFMNSTAVALILWYGGGEIIRSQLSLGELVAFLSYMRLFFQPLRELSQKYSIVQSAMASAERIFQLLDTSPRLKDIDWSAQGAQHPIDGDIQFDGIWFGYNQEVPVLKGIDLNIKSGESVALVGATGSGKSTMIHLLARFYDPDQGTIRIQETDVRDFPLKELRNHIGIIMQDIFIFPDTVLANIILDQPLDQDKLRAILNQTGLQSFIDKLPKGLETVIGEDVKDLSVGEKQLLSFVRALYRDPTILVLDEATSSIDVESEKMLEHAVAASFRGRTSFIIAHRLSTIRKVDRIIVIDNGIIVEQGTHDQLMASDSVYRKFVNFDLQKQPFPS